MSNMKGNPHYKKAAERGLMNNSDNAVLVDAMLAVAWEVRTQNMMTLRIADGAKFDFWNNQTITTEIRGRLGLDATADEC